MRRLVPGQVTQLLVGTPEADDLVVLGEYPDILLEAPNWTMDGRLLLNGEGRLFAVDAEHGGEPRVIPFEGLPPINNDHVLHPDGKHVLMTAEDGQIYQGSLDGGAVRCLTSGPGGHYLHGISPDGRTLAYVDLAEDGTGRLMLQDLHDGTVREIQVGDGHLDGPEFTPDGSALVLNTETFTDTPGHAQLARIDLEGSAPPERLVVSSTVDWFPHVSPDGRWATYLAYPAGTIGHPPDLPVEVRVVATEDWSTPAASYPVRGGQGTINVPSWSPDSARFAVIAYPLVSR
ncbi:MAG: biopolymer transporter Tol [Brachybacterium sp.]|nr:biopolymer transporter Tol [Brachybacterium sp.]